MEQKILIMESVAVQQKTYYPKTDDINREWYVVDANDENLGRLATRIATVLIGKHKPSYTPGVDNGDFVIVVNAERIKVTGNKMDEKMYHRHSGYPGGLRSMTLREMLGKHPDRVIRKAVWGMVPHTRLGRRFMKQLKIYAGPHHPHEAQKPKSLE